MNMEQPTVTEKKTQNGMEKKNVRHRRRRRCRCNRVNALRFERTTRMATIYVYIHSVVAVYLFYRLGFTVCNN